MEEVKRGLLARVTGNGVFLRYLVTGAAISVLDLTLFSLFGIVFMLPALLANVLSTLISVCVSYLINQRFVFRADRATWKSFFSFSGVTLINGFLLQSLVIWAVIATSHQMFTTPDSGIVLVVAKIVAMGIGAAANFIGYRFVFQKRGQRDVNAD